MPGTIFRFDGQYGFTINGTLLAEGTAEDSIFFTTNMAFGPEWWGGIRFLGVPSSGSRLAFCHIRKSGAASPGGVYCDYSSPAFMNCTISGNRADNGGGGAVLCEASSPIFTNCILNDNAAFYGGGVCCRQWQSSPSFMNCTLSGNCANDVGGGVCSYDNSSPIFLNCTISRNQASSGGGVYCSESSPAFTNCAISSNWTSCDGGVSCYGSSPTFTNCTVTGNSAGAYGGGVNCYYSSPTFNSTIIAFSIGWGVYFYNSAGSQVIYCDIFGNSSGNISFYNSDPFHGPLIIGLPVTTNVNGDSCDTYLNIFLDPLFADTAAGDYHLTVNSPCIDAGDPSLPLDPDETVADIGLFFFEQDLTIAPKSLIFGDVGVGGNSTLGTMLRNQSDTTISIYSVSSNCPAFTHDFDPADSVLLPGDSLEIHVIFAPDSVGTFTGALAIVSNAPVNDSLFVALSGVGGLVPAPVTNLMITTQGANATICWSPVDSTIYGNPIEVDAYLVYFAEGCNGPFWFHGYTSDTCYTHSGAVQFADAMFYQVTAYVGPIGLLQKALAELGEHPRREDLASRLRRAFSSEEEKKFRAGQATPPRR
jgi:parallel beta-helix repeat protein